MTWRLSGNLGGALVLFVVPWAWPTMPEWFHYFIWPIAGALLLNAFYGWNRERRENGKMSLDWPQIVILVGLVVALVGLGWQVYRYFPPPSDAEINQTAQVSQQTPDSRHLSSEQRKISSSSIIDYKVDLANLEILFSAHGGPESREYAEELASVFRDQGWNGRTHVPIDDDPHLTGLKLWYHPENGKDENAAKIGAVLDAAGIDYEWTPHEPPYSGAILFVYRKP